MVCCKYGFFIPSSTVQLSEYFLNRSTEARGGTHILLSRSLPDGCSMVLRTREAVAPDTGGSPFAR